MVMPKGSKHSDEAKERTRAAMKERWADPEYRERMLAARRRSAAANGNAQQKKAAAAAAAKLKGTKKTEEQKRKAVEARRAKNGGSYWANGRSASINMVPGPPKDEGPKEYTGKYPNISEARRGAIAEGKGVGWKHSEETKRKMSEARKKMWAEGVYANMKPATRRRVSRMELSLVPYLEKLGYQHVNEGNKFFVPHPQKGMVPDFVDREGRRVFEFFGDFWHPEADEAEVIRRYAEVGWSCTVLWERDLEHWKEQHKHLVGEPNATDTDAS